MAFPEQKVDATGKTKKSKQAAIERADRVCAL
jgi:hypothetical protein